jgi:hypothetical protein
MRYSRCDAPSHAIQNKSRFGVIDRAQWASETGATKIWQFFYSLHFSGNGTDIKKQTHSDRHAPPNDHFASFFLTSLNFQRVVVVVVVVVL